MAISVMIVEDESIIAHDLKNLLTKLDYRVFEPVHTGEEAVAMVGELKPDLILMDIVLSGEMDGIDAAEMIRGEYDIPIIFITSYFGRDFILRSKRIAPYGYILKPFKETELAIILEMSLERHRLEKELRISEERYGNLLRSIPDIVYSLDRNGCLTSINKDDAFLAEFGLRREEILGRPFQEIINEEDRNTVINSFLEAVTTRREYTKGLRFRIMTRRQVPQWFEIHSHMVFDSEGNYVSEEGVLRDITEKHLMEIELERHATLDIMTCAFNRHTGLSILERQMELSRRRGKKLAICYLDIDNLKTVNDSRGHTAGDELIRTVVSLINEIRRSSDTVIRMGGDEFVIILPDCDEEGSRIFMDRMDQALRRLNDQESPGYPVSVSCGSALFSPDSSITMTALLESADREMYMKKREKKGR